MKKRTINLARNLKLPTDAVTQTFAFMGRRGSGKTYACGKLAEELLDIGTQVVVLDPVGNWWGLRTLENGKPGYSIPVLGGANGDIPLEPTGGTVVADFVVKTGTSMVIDLSRFRKNDRKRFVVDFAEELFHKKKDAPSALHVIIDEAQHFVPQRVLGGDERLLGAVSDLTLMGRNYGIGVSLISQRPQKVNKDVLNQTECLFAFQMTGPHERKAIKEWIADKGIHDADAAVITKLPTGTAIVWSPQWLDFYGRVKIAKKRTADTSATPKAGTKQPKRKLAKIDLDAMSAAMAETIEAAKQRDPQHLRKLLSSAQATVSRLKNELATRVTDVEQVAVPVITDDQMRQFKHAIDRLHGMGQVVQDTIMSIRSALHEAGVQLGSPSSTSTPPRSSAVPKRSNGVAKPPAPSPTVETSVASSTPKPNGLGSGPTKILMAIASLHPTPLTRSQVSTLSGFSIKSSTFNNYLSTLRTAGYIDGGRNAPYVLTKTGLDAVGGRDTVPVMTTQRLLELWLPKLPGNAKTMLRLLVECYPQGMGRNEIAEAAGHSTRSSTFANYLSALTSNKLVEKRNNLYFASDSFYPTRA
jgi:hypothetical protein